MLGTLRHIRSICKRPGTLVVRRSMFARKAYRRVVSLGRPRTVPFAATDATAGDIPSDEGFKVVSPGTYSGSQEAVADSLEMFAGEALAGKKQNKKKQLSTYTLDVGDVSTRPSFLRFALNPELLGMIARYFGCSPVLRYAGLWRSQYVEGQPENSQLFHCDWEDTTQIKAFLYCSDVTSIDGPLTLIPAAATEGVQKRVGYSFAPGRYRVADEDVLPVCPRSDWRELTGPKGTLGLVDTTRCMHFGSRLDQNGQVRLLAVFHYVTPYAFDFPLIGAPNTPFASMVEGGQWSRQQAFALQGY